MPNADNSRNELEIVAEQQRRMAEIGRITTSSIDLSSVFSAFAEQAKTLVPFDRLAISNIDVDEGLIWDAHISGKRTKELDSTGPYTLADSALPARVYEDHIPVAANSAELERIARSDVARDNEIRISAGLISALFVPIVLQGRLVGSLVFRSSEKDPYGPNEIELASQIAAQIAGVVSANQQTRKLESEAINHERFAEEQKLLAEIGRIASSSLDFAEVLTQFSELAKKLVPHDRIVIATWSEDGTLITDQLASGIDVEGHTPNNVMKVPKDHVWKRLHQEKKPWVLSGENYQSYQDSYDIERARYDAGLRALLVVPLVWQGAVPGSIAFRSTDPRAYGEREIELAESVAAQIAGAVANAQQYALLEQESAERQRLVDEATRIAEIGRIVSSTLDLNQVLSSFADQARQLLQFNRLVISLVDDEKKILTDVLIDGVPITDRASDNRHPVTGDVKEDVIRNGSVIVANGAEMEEIANRFASERTRFDSGLLSLLTVPLTWQGSVVGTLAFRSENANEYGDHDLRTAQLIAAQIAGAVASSNQYSLLTEQSAERTRLADEQSRIAEIGRLASSTLDTQEGLTAIVEQAKSLVPFDRIVIAVANDDMTEVTDVLVDGTSVEKTTVGSTYPFGHSALQARVISDQTLVKASGSQYQELAQVYPVEKLRYDAGMRAMLMIPLVWQGRSFGTLNLRSEDPDSYGEHEVLLAEQIAAQIAGSVASSNQYALLARETAERTRLAEEQSRIAEIGRLVSSTLDLQEVLPALVAQAEQLVPFDRIVISVANDDQTEVTDLLVAGTDIANSPMGATYPFGHTKLQEQVLTRQQPFLATGDEYRKHAKSSPLESERYEAGMRSLLIEPLVWQGHCFGMMNLRSKNPDAYGDREVRLAGQICAQIAGAIATSNQYQKLREALSEVQLLATALETSEDAISIRDADKMIVYVNSAFERQSGYKKEDILGTDWVFPPRLNVAGAPTNAWKTVETGKTWRDIVTRERPDGSIYTVDATLRPLFDDDGNIDKYVGTRRDVTAQIAANENNRTQAAALEAAGDAVIILNTDTEMEWVNEAFVRDTGYTREEAMQQGSPFLRSDKDPDSVYDQLWATVKKGKPWRGRVWTRRKDGTEYPTECSLTPVFDENGEIAKFVGTRRDITDLVQAEQDREVRRDLDAQNQHLVDLNAQREEFFSTVSHELRTPLTSVMAFADILSRDREETLTDTQKEQLDVIKRNSRNLNDLVEDMLDFSRMSTDRLKLEKSEFEIHSLLDSVVESLEPTASQRSQVLSIQPHTEPVWIKADFGRLNQVISNLITNSCKYSPPETRVTLSVKSDAGKLAITVSDQGIGIPPEELDQIYSPFFRSTQHMVQEEIGTGLGLAISKTLVDLHNGSIEARSKVDQGTDITVTLPGASSAPTVNARA